MIFDLPPKQPVIMVQMKFPIVEKGKEKCKANGYNADRFREMILNDMMEAGIDPDDGVVIIYVSSFMDLGIIGAQAIMDRHTPIGVVECGNNIVSGRLPMILGDRRQWHYQFMRIWLYY